LAQACSDKKKPKGKGAGRKPKTTKADDHPTLGALEDE